MKSPQILFVFHLLFLVLYMHTPLGIFLKKSLFRGALCEQNIGFAVFECLCFWYFLTNLQGTVKAASRPDFHGGKMWLDIFSGMWRSEGVSKVVH